ncbi:pyridoxal phosphate-dependent aminotransferase [Oerskovia flava]|uniref:pyridoxal phosphate-dependent aminotransferase n=1 Tax=Oerskovia flava TaxID=2986422 RepID=UPI00223FB8D6|nr:aminotransferase class I/II-fold pyridoxal phosphate-dependent enzyme [Oerskovia sp. JB1-3-2]
MKVSRRAHVPPFAVMEVLAAANARRAAGESIINLCVGEPATGASEVVRRRAIDLLESGDLGYTEALGAPALREAIAGHYRRWYDLEIDPARVAVTTGSSGGFLLAFLASFDVGDRVALARPGYPAYRNILTALGCEVVELDCGPASRYQPTISQLMEAYYEAGLDGLVVASPANPTGTMIPPGDLALLADWCTQHDVRLISDEIYHGIVYGSGAGAGAGSGAGGSAGAAATAAEHLDSGAVVVNSFSKYWAMTGWRLGWLLLPEQLVAPVDALAGNVALSPPALAQHAGVAAFSPEGYAAAAENVARYAASRELVLNRLDDLGWTQTAPADGAFYVYADVSASGLDSVTWCERVLAEAGVALTPGTDFDDVHGHDWVRLSFAADPTLVAQAVERLVTWRRSV